MPKEETVRIPRNNSLIQQYCSQYRLVNADDLTNLIEFDYYINDGDEVMKPQKQVFTFANHIMMESANNQYVYRTAVEWKVDDFIRGFSGNVVAYGHTGSGKSHTIIGVCKAKRGKFEKAE